MYNCGEPCRSGLAFHQSETSNFKGENGTKCGWSDASTYKAANGRSFPAHVFSVKQDTGVFKVTVVEMPGKQTGSDAVVMKDATKAIVGSGTIKFDIPHRVRQVYGQQLGIAGANGGYSSLRSLETNWRPRIDAASLGTGGRERFKPTQQRFP